MGKFNEYLDIEATVNDIENKNGFKVKQITFWDLKSKAVAEAVLNEISKPGNILFPREGFPEQNVYKAWCAAKRDGSVGLYVQVLPNKANDFLETGLKKIIFRFLASKKPDGKPLYDNEKILRLEDVVAHKIESSDSYKEKFKAMSDAEISVADLWQRYLNNINDPTTREALALYSQIYTNTLYGHALSLANVMRIRAINPDATFVVSESTWNKWGFGIKKGAKKYPMWMVQNKYDPSSKEIDAAKTKLGHELSQLGDLGVTVLDAIRIEAEKEANKGQKVTFKPYYGYDISDTYRFNPKEDNPLVTSPGISSNVVYKLNDLAQKLEKEKQEHLDSTNKELIDKTDKKYAVAIDVMKNLCESNGIDANIILGGDATSQDKLIQILKVYYEYVINAKSEKNGGKGPNVINVLKPENISKYIQDAIQLTLLMNNIPYNTNNFTHSLQYTQNEAATLGPIIRKAAERIGQALVVNEGIGGWFEKAFKAALNKLGIKIVPNDEENVETPEMQMEAIKKNFNKFLDRINNPIIY